MSTLTLDYITLQTIKTYPYFKKGLNSILIEFSCFIQGYLYYYQQYQKKQQLVLQIQWLLELALLQKFCKCNSGARAFLHKNHQGQHLLGLNKTLMMMMVGRGNCIPTVSCIYFCTHTHWVKIRENWKIWIKIHTGLGISFVSFVPVSFSGGNFPYDVV